jgi:sugar lactone lactonase YvrE
MISPTTDAIAKFSFPYGANGSAITAGPDGNLWFTAGGNIGQFNLTTHTNTEFAIPAGSAPYGVYSQGITAGPDGNLWFTVNAEYAGSGGEIGMISPTTHDINLFPIPSNSTAVGITAGPDGNLWFTEVNHTGNTERSSIGTINVTTHKISEFPLPAGDTVSGGIAAGPDGNLWFTEAIGAYDGGIGKISPTTHAITEVATTSSGIEWITAGPDGNLWFTNPSLSEIGEVKLPETLAVSIDSSNVVPTSIVPYAPYSDLHLLSVFGGENVQVPIKITNQGQEKAKGTRSISIFLSTTPDLTGPVQYVQLAPLAAAKGMINGIQVDESIDLNSSDSLSDTIDVQSPTNANVLVAGQKYYIVVRLDDPSDGTDSNNVAATNNSFEFLGTPDYPNLFSDGTYFTFIRDTLEGNFVAKAKYPKIILTDAKSFIGNLEGDSLSPYLDGKGHPTISVGINIDAQFNNRHRVTRLGRMLAEAVRIYRHRLVQTDFGVLKWLEAQALTNDWEEANEGPPFISEHSDRSLFLMAFKDSLHKAQASVGGAQAYNGLGGYIDTALVDIAHNHGDVYPDVASALTQAQPDYVLAGFDMLDQPRSLTIYDPKNRGFITRLEAEYENLLIEHKEQLGTVQE